MNKVSHDSAQISYVTLSRISWLTSLILKLVILIEFLSFRRRTCTSYSETLVSGLRFLHVPNCNLLQTVEPQCYLYCLSHGCANHATEGETLRPPFHCCDVTNPPYLFNGELCTSTLHCKRLFVDTVCCRRVGQCFSVLRTRTQTSY